jgi:hypothetical protein
MKERIRNRKWHKPAISIYAAVSTLLIFTYAPWEVPVAGTTDASTPLDPAPVWDTYYSTHGARVVWVLLGLIWFGLVGVPALMYYVWTRESTR